MKTIKLDNGHWLVREGLSCSLCRKKFQAYEFATIVIEYGYHSNCVRYHLADIDTTDTSLHGTDFEAEFNKIRDLISTTGKAFPNG